MTNTKTSNKRILNRSRAAIVAVLLLMGFMVYRLAELQLIHPDENRNNAILQYTNEVTINAKRGTIYDRTMQKLAVSTTVQTVFISPSDIKDDAQEELIINGLNEILGVDKDYIRERAAKKSSRYQIMWRARRRKPSAALSRKTSSRCRSASRKAPSATIPSARLPRRSSARSAATTPASMASS